MRLLCATLKRALPLFLAATLVFSVLPAVAETGADNVTVVSLGEEETSDTEPAIAEPEAGESAEAAPSEDGDEPTAKVESEIKYIANASVALKVRKEPNKEANGAGSIKTGEFVYILELGPDWSKVRLPRADGYVMTKYLENMREYDAENETAGEVVEAPQFETVALEDNTGFKNNYYAYTVENAAMYEAPSKDSRRIVSIKIYNCVVVSENSGGWSYCRYNNTYGYIPTDSLFKWDRINAYAGEIPGLVCYPLMISVKRSTNIYSMKNNKVLQTINPGSMICSQKVDALGRYVVPYHREDGYINAEDVAGEFPVTPWEDAQPGDLISVMTTYYAVGISTINYQGRNWNIYLASSTITGTVLEPGDTFNMNKCIGPYAKSTGYKRAPIMNPRKLWGYGGGTCQVNTTFYITTIALPLLVNHRKVHAEVGIYYCKKGFDAAVGGGDINLEMTNTMPYAVRYQYFVSDGCMTCCIYRDH